jgi:Cu-Zn family superoxide dismutase
MMLLLACAGRVEAQPAVTADAEIVSDAQQTIGRANFVNVPSGVLMTLQVSNLIQGVHALHVHETGRCDPSSSFQSAGGHFNPDGHAHGFRNPKGPHAGDLPNLYVPDSGFIRAELLLPDVTLTGPNRRLLDADGSALVIHLGPDDYRTDPAGVAGPRVACGVITLTPAGQPDPTVVTQIRSITVPVTGPHELAGRHVVLENVEVRTVASASALWIGSSANEELLVVAEDDSTRRALEQLHLTAGGKINVEGTVDVVTKATPDARLTGDWGLSTSDADKVKRRGVVL